MKRLRNRNEKTENKKELGPRESYREMEPLNTERKKEVERDGIVVGSGCPQGECSWRKHLPQKQRQKMGQVP